MTHKLEIELEHGAVRYLLKFPVTNEKTNGCHKSLPKMENMLNAPLSRSEFIRKIGR